MFLKCLIVEVFDVLEEENELMLLVYSTDQALKLI